MALASILSGDTVTGQGRTGRGSAGRGACDVPHLNGLKARGEAVTPGGFCRLQFSEGSPAKSDKGQQPCWLLSLPDGTFAMRRCCRRHRRSMGFFDQLPDHDVTLGGDSAGKGVNRRALEKLRFFRFPGLIPRITPRRLPIYCHGDSPVHPHVRFGERGSNDDTRPDRRRYSSFAVRR